MSTSYCTSGLAIAMAGGLVSAGLMLAPATGYSQITEITVTTRKKEENLQEVPLAVTAITSEQIERQGISSLDDVVSQDPSVQFDTSYGPADTRVTIRGLSNSRGRSNVAFLVDGIDVTTENLNAGGSGLLANRRLLTDVERIEIVKGPQSALYGRAAFAGAINYVTKDPSDTFEGKVRLDFGDYGKQEVGLSLSGPLIDGVLGVRATSVWYSSDGFYKNSLSGDDLADNDGRGFALTTVYTPTDALRFKLRGEYSKEDSGPLANARIGGGRTGHDLHLYEYPQAALDAGLGRNAQYIPAAVSGTGLPGWDTTSVSTSTALVNFGQYCPPGLQDPSKGPGFCVPTHFGSAAGKVVAQSENPLTGDDFPGTSTETRRLALETSVDLGVGKFSIYSGYTDFEGTDLYDQDWQAVGRPDALLGEQIADSYTNTQQFSNEFRFASQLDGPVQFTLGALYWTETRKYDDRSTIIFCTLTRRAGYGENETDIVVSSGSYCDGQAGTLDNWQAYYRQLQPQVPGPWRADTDSWSFYGLLEWQVADDWTLTFEDRFVSETFDLTKPNQASCSQFFGPNPGGVKMLQETIGPGGVILNDQRCSSEFLLYDGNFPPQAISLQGTFGYRINRGNTVSHFSTPKLTLQWQPTDRTQYYFSWAKAQKPGGISAIAGGGAPVPMRDDRFDPEKMTAWELGAKTDWDAAGALRLNFSGFFQDYTDKQVGTQVLQDGVLQARVVNAAAAEIWGAEMDALWAPDAVPGLTLRMAYTYLDATYATFFDDTTSALRAATNAGACSIVYKGGQGTDPDDLSDPANGGPYCRLNLSGNQLERTPKHALVTGINITRPFLDTNFQWAWDFNAQWQSKRYLDHDNQIYFDSYWLADTSIGFIGDKVDILFYVDNLFDDDTIKTGGSGPDFAAQVVELGFTAGLGVFQYFGGLPNPRQFGVRASYRF